MNVDLVKIALTAVLDAITATQIAVRDVVDAELKVRSFNGLRGLAGVDTVLLESAEKLMTINAKLDNCVVRALPRKSRKAKAEAAAASGVPAKAKKAKK